MPAAESRLLFAERAVKDLERLDKPTADRVLRFIGRRMRADTPPANLDMKPLEGRPPWLRVRTGDVRILCRRLTSAELARESASAGYLVARIVDRRDLDRAVATL